MAESVPTNAPAAMALMAKALRIRYAIIGLVMALLWVGHQGEPAWLHAVRLLLVLLTISPLLALTRRYRERHTQAAAERHPDAALYWLIGTRIVVIVIAVGLGSLLARLVTHHSDAPKLVLLRLALLALSIPWQVRLERRRQALGLPPRVPVRSSRIIAAKLLLVALALGADWLLGRWTANADLIVAAAIFAAVALAGPKLNRYLVIPGQAAAPLPATNAPAQPGQTAAPAG
jgi:hypothetical protein